MKASILDLRRRMSEVLHALDRNESVTIHYRGRERALLVPAGNRRRKEIPVREHPAFGMWKDRKEMDDVAGYVRSLRAPRNGPA